MSWRDFEFPLPPLDKEDKADKAKAPDITSSSLSALSTEGEPQKNSPVVEPDNLLWWLDQIGRAGSKEEIFSILKKFQPLPWTDEHRAQISQAYHKRLDWLK